MKNLSKCQEMMTIQQKTYYSYHQNFYKLISIDLSRQVNTNIPQQLNFTGKLEEDDDTTMIFIAEK